MTAENPFGEDIHNQIYPDEDSKETIVLFDNLGKEGSIVGQLKAKNEGFVCLYSDNKFVSIPTKNVIMIKEPIVDFEKQQFRARRSYGRN